MRLEDVLDQDPDQLSYAVTGPDCRLPVRFELLTAADALVLWGPSWAHAVFQAVWLNAAIAEFGALKVVAPADHDAGVLGLVLPGTIKKLRGPLEDSLLETAPELRYGNPARSYRGVGRVLVARLVAESIVKGGGGAIRVRVRPGMGSFYTRLGFRSIPGTPYFMVLPSAQALRLLEEALGLVDVR